MLTFRGPVMDFALTSDTQGILEGVVGFTFVQANLGSALHVCVGQPVDDEERPLDPTISRKACASSCCRG